ncbi:MAG: LysE family transporter [Clostridiales Family XIII bacterium]|jgi:L-lysine exporter family protein LysE/ArgO|nr:LysE family transporter [Clostridiales Family XIII bacterium]
MDIFLQGLMLGLAYVAPIGMQNMFVINSALTQRRTRAYMTAGIVVFFDVTLALACFLGVGAIMQNVPWAERAILLAGSIVVAFIGISLIRHAGDAPETKTVDVPLRKLAFSAFVVTWGNAQAIIDGTMLLGASRAAMGESDGWVFLFAVMCASTLWFFGITFFLQIFGSRFTPRVIRWINIICGVVIIVYAGRLLAHFLILVIG